MDNNTLGAETLKQMVESLCIREDDHRLIKFRKYYDIAKDVYRDLNLYSIRWTKRFLIEVDQKTRSVKLPPETILLSSVSVLDDCGKIIPLILNNNIHEDFVDISQAHQCGCECGCESDLCGTVKTYEVIYGKVSAPMPDGSMKVFDTYSRKTVYPNGDYYHEYTVPVPTYEDEEIISTELEERKEFICKLETKGCGCVKDCDENKQKLDSCCGPNEFFVECGSNICVPQETQTYGYEKGGDRISFDTTFSYKHVLVRVYVNEKGPNVMVPLVAKQALLLGIKADENPFEKVTGYSALAQQRRQGTFDVKYDKAKKKLFRLLNRLSLRTILLTLTPGRKMV
jgi:hypothetical protein